MDEGNRQRFIDSGLGVSSRPLKCEASSRHGVKPASTQGLRLFEAAARSFKRAAEELNLTPGAISHGISSLEEWLGVELFDRSRELALTSVGNRYLPYVKEALSMIAKATSETVAAIVMPTIQPVLPLG